MSALASMTIVLAGGFGTAAVATVRNVIERRRARRMLRDHAPLGTQLAEGTVVRVTGTVRVGDSTLIAPLSGRTCVVYRSRVSALSFVPPTKGSKRPQLTPLTAVTPFVIDRGAEGLVHVESTHVTLDLPPIKRLRVARDRREHFMLIQGTSLGSTILGRLEEIVVEPGAVVSVVGLMMLDPASEPDEGERGFREAAPAQLRLTGNLEHPIVIGSPVEPV